MNLITPKIDIAFKKIFGVEENKDLLISLINSIVSEEDRVSDVTLLNPYNPKNFRSDKLSILDIKAVSQEGKRFNIEIQISNEADYDKRALFYWSKLYSEQLKHGEDYSSLSKSIGIHILNFTSILDTEKYHNVFGISEKNSGLHYFKDLELHTIELTKFSEHAEKDIAELVAKVKNALDMWIAFLTRNDLLKVDKLPRELDDPNLRKAMQVLSVMNFSDDERDVYEGHLKWLRIEANTLKKYKEEGKEEGIEEGRKKGIEEGRKKEAKQIAVNMLNKGMSAEDVSDITGLSVDSVLELRNFTNI